MIKKNTFHYTYRDNFNNTLILLDRNIIYNFVLKFFRETLFSPDGMKTPTVIGLKAKFDNGNIRSVTHNYIILPSSGPVSDIESLPSFNNFMFMVDSFLSGNAKNYDLDNVIDLIIDYYVCSDTQMNNIYNSSKYNKIESFNNQTPLSSTLINEDSDLHKMRVDIYPNNMAIKSWFKDEGNVIYNQVSDKLVMLYRKGLLYLFELNDAEGTGYTCTVMFTSPDGINKQVLSRFIDISDSVNTLEHNTFTRKYYRVITEKELKNLKESIQLKLRQEFGLTERDIGDDLDISGIGLPQHKKEFYDILDRVYSYKDGILIEFKNIPTTKFLSSLNTRNKSISKEISSVHLDKVKGKIIALDLETRSLPSQINPLDSSKGGYSTLEVISACWCNSIEERTFYVTDYDSPNRDSKLMSDLINSLLDFKNNGSMIYCHNLSSFDGVFLLKTIYDLSDHGYKIDLIYKDNKMIVVTVSKRVEVVNEEGNKVMEKFQIKFCDSLLILPASLAKLAKSLGINSGKLDTWDVASHNTADLNDTQFREGLLEYNMIDCKVLHEVIVKFYQECRTEFGIDILDCPTLPSIAFKLFRTHFMDKKHKIGITWLEQYDKLSPGYRGGHVDVYKPEGKNLYYYDINSLYPAVMNKNLFPIGIPEYFEYSDYRPFDTNLFGIVHARIKAPLDMKAPILLTEVDGRVVAPVGNWEGIYCTEELKNAMKYGYEVQVLWGYHWEEKAKVFSKYVKTLYDNRLKYPKSDPRNLISKLMLNSLYGRFGLTPHLNSYVLADIDDDISDLHDTDYIKLGDKVLLSLDSVKNRYKSYKVSINEGRKFDMANIALPMAMFVTAYARIEMSKYKVHYADNLYYSDTDSIILDKKLPSSVVSNTELGLFKLEHEIDEAVFLAPKVYAFKSKSGEYICKIKGSKHKLDFNVMESLLVKNSSYDIEQVKWYRSLENSNITIKDQLYKLRATENKRSFVFNTNGTHWIDTKPFVL
jgi:hypothetical protein